VVRLLKIKAFGISCEPFQRYVFKEKLLSEKEKTDRVTHLKQKWSTFSHNGVAFPPAYEPHHFSILIRGKTLELSPLQEEMMWAIAKKKDTPYINDPTFTKNFIDAFKKVLPQEYDYPDLKYEDLDFGDIKKFQDDEKKKVLGKDSKKRLAALRKTKREELRSKFGYAVMDGRTVEVANWMVEPPGIFMGRGAHPLRGHWKPRVNPEDVTLNLGEDAKVPEEHWAGVVHDHNSMWVARWIDKLTENEKYVWLSESSHLRQMREKAKFDKAVSLEKKIDRVREYVENGMNSKDEATRKVATVCYLIDRLAMRVGDEKDTDEADTVGASTLRCEHLKLSPGTMEFDFLGKDSVRWEKTLRVTDEADRLAYANLQAFLGEKRGCDLVFDGIGSVKVNRFLGKAAQGLTAKVFRTYLATKIVRDYLQENCGNTDDSDFSKIYCARMANLQAAITCNHKRTPPKTWETSLAKKEERLNQLTHQEPKTEKALGKLKVRIEKLEKTIKLTKTTKDYNLNTSLKNYIDPRVYKAWTNRVRLDWRILYSKTLQKKFEWVESTRDKMPEVENHS